MNDSDVYKYIIYDSDYKIVIQKIVSAIKEEDKSLGYSYFTADSYYDYKSTIDLSTYKIPKNEESLISKDKDFNMYKVSVKDIKKDRFVDLRVLTDKKNNIIWSAGYAIPFLEAKKINDNEYVVISATVKISIDYVHLDNKIPVVERYDMPFITSGAAFTAVPISAKILKNDIIRLEYKDGAIEHWKIKQTKKDFDNNNKMSTKNNISARDHALIWWNGVGKGNPYVNHINNKSWDYNEDRSVEPTYE